MGVAYMGHLIQDVDSTLPNFGNVKENSQLMDINYGTIGSINGYNGDWMHINSIDYNPILDQIVISSRNTNEFYIIDHSTSTEESSGHSGGNYGKGGDFLSDGVTRKYIKWVMKMIENFLVNMM